MKNNEIEIIEYPKIKHIKLFVNEITSVENHIHSEFEILLCLKNPGVIRINTNSSLINEGDIFFINSNDVHSISHKVSEKSEIDIPIFLLIQVSTNFLREYLPQLQTTSFKSCNLKDYIEENELNEIKSKLINASISYLNNSEHYKLNVIEVLASFFYDLYKYVPYEILSETRKQKLKIKNLQVERILSYIDANFEGPIKLEDLANEENITCTHFSHLFTSYFGITFQEFINIKRMEQCIRLMPNKEKTLIQISYESGFSDPKYMTKMFLKKFDCTPKVYRDKYLTYSDNQFSRGEKLENILSAEEALNVINSYINERK